MNEALRYTPGVQVDEYGVEQRFDWMKIRGFTADTTGVFRDGMRWSMCCAIRPRLAIAPITCSATGGMCIRTIVFSM